MKSRKKPSESFVLDSLTKMEKNEMGKEEL